jgi:anti-sigma regulatory factor (Ser/Thr protein kinase)
MDGGEPIEMLIVDPRGLREIRAAIRRLAAATDLDPDDVVLATSELVTNALLYVEGPCRVRARVVDSGVRIEVTDRGAVSIPSASPQVPSAANGRGLAIVDRLVSRWDVRIHDGIGKTVWFEFDPAGA